MTHHITFDLESESTPREIELWVREMLMLMARGVPFSRITVGPKEPESVAALLSAAEASIASYGIASIARRTAKEAAEGRPLGRIE